MDKIADAFMLKETAPRNHVAMVYGGAGFLLAYLLIGGR